MHACMLLNACMHAVERIITALRLLHMLLLLLRLLLLQVWGWSDSKKHKQLEAVRILPWCVLPSVPCCFTVRNKKQASVETGLCGTVSLPLSRRVSDRF